MATNKAMDVNSASQQSTSTSSSHRNSSHLDNNTNNNENSTGLLSLEQYYDDHDERSVGWYVGFSVVSGWFAGNGKVGEKTRKNSFVPHNISPAPPPRRLLDNGHGVWCGGSMHREL